MDSHTHRSRGNKTGLDGLFKLKKQRGLEALEGSSRMELEKVRVRRVDMVDTLYNITTKTF